ncbi:hypothetical protein [Lysinibacillus xylanilyticus]|uniref:hypothetical protein n=1 Tax=Lysinibacillus xylanilyticus TaxID=582475 RepID=UPI003D98409B
MGNTDVPASLAGYYYQLLIACKELVILINNHDDLSNHVAIEKGSDVKVFTKNDVCIEAKFYSDASFTKSHKSIKHTIYNFYNDFKINSKNSKPSSGYIYKTNVPVSSKDAQFFEIWNNKNISNYDDYIEYVKECILNDSVIKKPFSDDFEKYKKRANVQPDSNGKVSFSAYYNALKEDIKNGKECYTSFSDIGSNNDIKSFINSIEFEFGSKKKSKLYTIKDIYNEITDELKKYDSSLSNDDCKKIRNWVIEEFFETISNLVNDGVSVKRALDAIVNHKNLKIKYLDDTNFLEFKEVIDQSIESFGIRIKRSNHDSELDELSNILLKFKEKFCEEVEKHTVEDVAGRFVMGSYFKSPHLIMDMLKAFSVVVNFNEDETDIQLATENLTGINNIAINNKQQFTLKGIDNTDFNMYADILIMEFIKDTQHKFLNKVDGEETIVFETKCRPCEYAIDNLNNLIINNAQVFSNITYQQLFMSMEYKCTECLQLGKCVDDTKISVKRFLGGDCHGGNV